jgi:NAD(P)-dependent dehydrogenase (short-subunit alcohol dehydrogenase family)
LLETTDEIWDKHMEINLKGVFLCTQIAARHMIERNYGKIELRRLKSRRNTTNQKFSLRARET